MTKKRENGRTDPGLEKKERMKNRQRNTTDVERRSGNTFGVRKMQIISKQVSIDDVRGRAGVCTALLLSSRQPVSDWLPPQKAATPADPTTHTHPAAGHTHTQHTRRRSQKHPLPTHSCVLCASTHVSPPTTSTTLLNEREKKKIPPLLYVGLVISRPTLRWV